MTMTDLLLLALVLAVLYVWVRLVDAGIGWLTAHDETPEPVQPTVVASAPDVFIAPVIGMPSIEEPWAVMGKAYDRSGKEVTQ
jgi:hypothetical protein